MKMTLQEAARIVAVEVASVDAGCGPFPMSGTPDQRARWHTKRRDSMTALEQSLGDKVQASISQQWSGCRVRIAGVSASSTAGLQGALMNWLRAADRRQGS